MFKISGMNCGVVWDAASDKPLIRFVQGVAETESQDVAEKLKALGYVVEDRCKQAESINAKARRKTDALTVVKATASVE